MAHHIRASSPLLGTSSSSTSSGSSSGPPTQVLAHQFEGISVAKTPISKEDEDFLGDIGFKVGAQIGEGSYGQVFYGKCKAFLTKLVTGPDHIQRVIGLKGKPCAIKRFPNSGRWTDELYREVQTQVDLDHPNIVQVYVVSRSFQYIYIIMELLKVGTLNKLLDDLVSALDEYTALPIIQDLISGLQYLHNQGIVHGDIHDENVMIDIQYDQMVCKLVDFGKSTALGEGNAKSDMKRLAKLMIQVLNWSDFQRTDIKNDLNFALRKMRRKEFENMNEVVAHLSQYLISCNDTPPPDSEFIRQTKLYLS